MNTITNVKITADFYTALESPGRGLNEETYFGCKIGKGWLAIMVNMPKAVGYLN